VTDLQQEASFDHISVWPFRGLISGLSAVSHYTMLCRHHMKDLLPRRGPSDLRFSVTKM